MHRRGAESTKEEGTMKKNLEGKKLMTKTKGNKGKMKGHERTTGKRKKKTTKAEQDVL